MIAAVAAPRKNLSIKSTVASGVNAPAVPPVTEQFEAAAIVDKKMSKAARIVSALHN